MSVSSLEPTNSYIPQDVNSGASEQIELENSPSWREFLLELGELPAVQDRFHALLKHRLQVEIQHNPPLFPWETTIQDYETAPFYAVASSEAENLPVFGESRSPQVWLNHLRGLMPVAIPEPVLIHLLQRCQEVVQTSLREGAKLVQAVEDLFPDQSQALNQIAGMVMTSPARSGALASPVTRIEASVSYDTATPAQQMALSLLTAREILNSLTLTVTAGQPLVERQWQTELGMLQLRAEYRVSQELCNLHIATDLPVGGSLTLSSEGLQTTTQRPTAGWLSVELVDPQPDQPCLLTVQLTGREQAALVFAIRIAG
jgi:hypothetical protein